MFIVQLKFSENKSKADELMHGHNEWIQQGFADGVFLMVGKLQPELGGAVFANNISYSDLQARINQDPFVTHAVVSVDIIEFDPVKTDPRMEFLLADN